MSSTSGSIVIDSDKCTVCSACVAECPAYVLRLDNGGLSVAAQERCIVCGHCVAVCPVEAIEHEGLPGECDALDKALTLDPRAVMQLIRSRRSIRAYSERAVSDEQLAALLDAGRYAPTAHNRQPWRFTVIRGRDKLARVAATAVAYMQAALRELADANRRQALAGALPQDEFDDLRRMAPAFRAIVNSQREGVDMLFRGAPALIVIRCSRNARSGGDDCHYAAANMMLMAHALGLGTCLVGFLVGPARASREVAAAVGVPPEDDIGAALVVGHPKYRYRRMVPRRQPPVDWM